MRYPLLHGKLLPLLHASLPFPNLQGSHGCPNQEQKHRNHPTDQTGGRIWMALLRKGSQQAGRKAQPGELTERNQQQAPRTDRPRVQLQPAQEEVRKWRKAHLERNEACGRFRARGTNRRSVCIRLCATTVPVEGPSQKEADEDRS